MSMGADIAHIDDGIDQASRGKKCRQFRHFFAHPAFYAVNIFEAADAVPGFEAHQNKRGMHRGIGRVHRGKSGIQANVGNHDSQIIRGNRAANQLFHRCDLFLRFDQAGSGGSFDVDHELSGVSSGKEGKSQQTGKGKG